MYELSLEWQHHLWWCCHSNHFSDDFSHGVVNGWRFSFCEQPSQSSSQIFPSVLLSNFFTWQSSGKSGLPAVSVSNNPFKEAIFIRCAIKHLFVCYKFSSTVQMQRIFSLPLLQLSRLYFCMLQSTTRTSTDFLTLKRMLFELYWLQFIS